MALDKTGPLDINSPMSFSKNKARGEDGNLATPLADKSDRLPSQPASSIYDIDMITQSRCGDIASSVADSQHKVESEK